MQYFLCLEYKEPKKDYGKSYISFDQNGLVFEKLYSYSLEQIDAFLAKHPLLEILKSLQEANVIYFLKEIPDLRYITLSIHYFEEKKERHLNVLENGVFAFDLNNFLQQELTYEMRKNLFNHFGGYYNKNSTNEKMKCFIRSLKTEDIKIIFQNYQLLQYEEQRKVKSIIYKFAPSKYQQKFERLHNSKLNGDQKDVLKPTYSLKKYQREE